MPPRVYLASCDPGNFDRTVLSEIDLSDYPDHPEALSGMDTVRFWGVRDGSRNADFFEKMKSGDLVLFYQDDRYVGSGWVGTKFRDEAEWASSTFWNDAPSHLIYTLQEFRSEAVPKAAVNRIFDYSESYSPQGLTRVADSKMTRRPEVIRQAIKKYTEKHR